MSAIALQGKALVSALDGEVGRHDPALFLERHLDATIVCDLAAVVAPSDIPTVEKPHA